MRNRLRIINHQPSIPMPQVSDDGIEANGATGKTVQPPGEPGCRHLDGQKYQIKDQPKNGVEQPAFLHAPALRRTRRALTVPAVACDSKVAFSTRTPPWVCRLPSQ